MNKPVKWNARDFSVIFIVLLSISQIVYGQTERTWIGSGNWNSFTNWSPAGNPSDARLIFSDFGNNVSNNNQSGNSYRRIQFLPSTDKSFSITGNQIRLLNPAGGAFGWVVNESEFNHQISSEIFFDDFQKIGVISTKSSGGLTIGGIRLGTEVSAMRLSGESPSGVILISGGIIGSNQVVIGEDEEGIINSNTRVTFTGDNQLMSGSLRISGGVLRVQHGNALGQSLLSLIDINGGATLEIIGGITLTGRNFNINGNGITSVSGNNIIEGTIFLGRSSGILCSSGSLILGNIGKQSGSNAGWNTTFNGAGNISLNGTLGKIGGVLGNLIKTGSGVLYINNECAHTGSTSISSNGIIELGGDNLLPFNSPLLLNVGNLRTAGYNQAFGSLEKRGNSNSSITLGTGDHNLTFGPSQDIIWTGTGRLRILNWNGTEGQSGNPGSGKIFVESPDGGITPGLSEQQLSQITFVGFCDGAALLPSGELVPADIPYITKVEGAQPSGAAGLYTGYTGTIVTITGCQFTNVSELTVGPVTLTPPNFTVSGNIITFKLSADMEGLISLKNAKGIRVSPQPMKNLGYFTKLGSKNWMTDADVWLGDEVPLANYKVTVVSGQIRVTSPINNPNLTPPNNNHITISSGGSVRLLAENVFPSNTPINLNGGSIRVFDRTANNETNNPPPGNPGFSQILGTLQLSGNSNISLGAGLHNVRFSNSSAIDWDLTKNLTINNWKGSPVTSGTEGRIFFGNNATGLTAQQLARIRFTGFCPGAKLLSTGELVPSDAPFISGVISTPGGLQTPYYVAYYGSRVRLDGCQFDDVQVVKIGGVTYNQGDFDLIEIDPDPLVSGDEFYNIEFDVDVNQTYEKDFVKVETLIDEGFSDKPLRILGHITKGDGIWNNSNTWLGDIIPLKDRNVYINNHVTLDNYPGDDFMPDSVIVNKDASFTWQNGVKLEVNKAFINNGTINPAMNSFLLLHPNATLTNNESFDSQELGRIEFVADGVINGSKGIIFNDLIINDGTIYYPRFNAFPNSLPTITGSLIINGGKIDVSPTTTNSVQGRGPLYTPGANLVYNTGGTYIRGREWNGNQNFGTPGRPFNVIVRNATRLSLNGIFPASPTPGANGTLYIDGDLRITNNGEVIHDMNRPIEIYSNLEIGVDPSSTGKYSISGSSLAAVVLHGNFIRHVNSDFNQGMRRIEFVGNQSSIISAPGDTEQPFRWIRINGNKQVILETVITVETTLDLHSGYITSSNDNLLVIQPAANILGGGVGSFVNGPLRKITASTPANAVGPFEFKVGKLVGEQKLYNPVFIANLTHNGSTSYSAEFFETDPLSAPFQPDFVDASLTGIWANRWWNIQKLGSGFARVAIPYISGLPFTPAPNPCDECFVAVVKFDNAINSWKFTKSGGNFNNPEHPWPEILPGNSSGLVYSNIMTEYSPFTIGFAFNSILPVTLLDFSAILKQNDVLLQWEIADNKDLSYFEVEYSMNGENFISISKVMPTLNTKYHYTHANLTAGVHYYRLKIIERDGTKKYSKVEIVQLGVQVTIIQGLLQNPIQGTEAKVKIYSTTAQTAEATVVDMSGRMVLRQKAGLMTGENLVPISVMFLPKGMYKMVVTTDDGKRGVFSMLR